MPQSQQKVQKLMKQYPFLREVRHWTSKIDEALSRLEEFSVFIERADPDLMFRQPDDVWGGGRYLGHPTEPNWRGSRYECFYPVNRGGVLGKRRDAEEWNSPVRTLFNREIWDWMPNPGPLHGEDAAVAVQAVVWVSSMVWYYQPDDHNHLLNGPGVPRRVDTRLTVYLEPEEGWRQLYITADPQVNVTLLGSRLWKSPESDDSFRDVIYDRLSRLAMQFEDEVFDQGLGVIIDRSKKKGMSGRFGDVKVLSYVIAGRIAIQFECGDDSVTFLGADEKRPKFGFSNIDGTLPNAIKMVEAAIDFWRQATPEIRKSTHVDDTKVGLGL